MPGNARIWSSADPVLGQRRRRWPSTGSALDVNIVLLMPAAVTRLVSLSPFMPRSTKDSVILDIGRAWLYESRCTFSEPKCFFFKHQAKFVSELIRKSESQLWSNTNGLKSDNQFWSKQEYYRQIKLWLVCCTLCQHHNVPDISNMIMSYCHIAL